ncbi:MAG: KAP family NTPase [Clostridia bacterium]|nr:KAP family NTPase [Clostridia bacterium]
MFNDLIGRKEIIDKIEYLIEELPEQDNFCLALNGEWGSGKSSVFKMLYENLEKHEEYITVLYDAWKNNFYPDPLIAILYCIIDTLKNYLYLLTNTGSEIKRGALQIAKEFSKGLLSECKKKDGKIGFIASVISTIKDVVLSAKDTLINNQKLKDFKSYQDLLIEVKSALNDLTNFEILQGKQTKLIIIVDEIDRCLPNEQLIVLERIHHLFNVENCIVLVALNRQAIIQNFKTTYGTDGNEYLRKFFDYNFMLNTN